MNQDPKVDFTFSIPDEKKIYIYNEDHFSLEIPVYSETGKIRYATISRKDLDKDSLMLQGTDNDLDVEFGFTARVINQCWNGRGNIGGESKANPAKIVITGRPNDILKKHTEIIQNKKTKHLTWVLVIFRWLMIKVEKDLKKVIVLQTQGIST